MSLLGNKIAVMVAWAAVKMISGLLPLWAKKLLAPRHVDTAVGIVLCIGGGVLLATVFIHMIPETQVRESPRTERKMSVSP